MRIVATVLTAWIVWRWIGFGVGLGRVRRFDGPVRREARRTVIARGAWNIFFSVAVTYLWAGVNDAQPSDVFVGFLAAALMCSLAIGIIAWFMQPEERTIETLSICSLRPIVQEEEHSDSEGS